MEQSEKIPENIRQVTCDVIRERGREGTREEVGYRDTTRSKIDKRQYVIQKCFIALYCNM